MELDIDFEYDIYTLDSPEVIKKKCTRFGEVAEMALKFALQSNKPIDKIRVNAITLINTTLTTLIKRLPCLQSIHVQGQLRTYGLDLLEGVYDGWENLQPSVKEIIFDKQIIKNGQQAIHYFWPRQKYVNVIGNKRSSNFGTNWCIVIHDLFALAELTLLCKFAISISIQFTLYYWVDLPLIYRDEIIRILNESDTLLHVECYDDENGQIAFNNLLRPRLMAIKMRRILRAWSIIANQTFANPYHHLTRKKLLLELDIFNANANLQ